MNIRIIAIALFALFVSASGAETWRGLTVAAERRCATYSAKDYPYPQSVEPRIVAAMGGQVYGPYTGRCFGSIRETDIEHMVARSEAHDSGLCAADAETRKRFASDLLNLTLAAPDVNRRAKSDRDAADWLPEMNRCWFAARVVAVKKKYGLTVDRREAEALERVLAGCESTALVIGECAVAPARPAARPAADQGDPLAQYDDDGNGQITCGEARAHGIAPVSREHPAYTHMRDADGDGVVCE